MNTIDKLRALNLAVKNAITNPIGDPMADQDKDRLLIVLLSLCSAVAPVEDSYTRLLNTVRTGLDVPLGSEIYYQLDDANHVGKQVRNDLYQTAPPRPTKSPRKISLEELLNWERRGCDWGTGS